MRNNVLVIDDDIDTISVISLILEQENYEVLATTNIQEGLDYFETKHPVLIILDLEMPVMHGLEVLKRLKPGINKDFSVIIMTGYGNDANIKICYDLGVYAFLSKPVRLIELKGLVRNAVLWEDYKHSLNEHKKELDLLVKKKTAKLNEEIDIRKQTEQKLLQTNQIKDRILNILSWDLRSPLSNIVMNLKFLCDVTRQTCSDDIYQQMNDTYVEARNTWQLTENIFLWARCEKGEVENSPEICNLNSILKDTLLFYSNSIDSKHLKIDVNIDDNLEISADRKMAYTIIQNVVSNAMKYSHPAGNIDISASLVNQKVALWVKDYGVGIAEHVLPDIMDISKPVAVPGTANEKGSGLGLTISKALANIIGAEITIESKTKVGTIVTILFSKP